MSNQQCSSRDPMSPSSEGWEAVFCGSSLLSHLGEVGGGWLSLVG